MARIRFYVLLLALLVSLTACGEKPATNAEDISAAPKEEFTPETAPETIPEAAPAHPSEKPACNLTGQWKQINVEDGDEYYGAVLDDEKIELYWICDNGGTYYLYWAGSYVTPEIIGESYTWTSQVGSRRTDIEAIAASDGVKVFTYDDSSDQISCSVTHKGVESTITLERGEWAPGLQISNVPDALKSGFDPATNQVLTYDGIDFSYPAYFTHRIENSSDTPSLVSFNQPEHPDYHAYLELDSLGFAGSLTEAAFMERTPGVIDSLIEDGGDNIFDAVVKETTVAGRPAFIFHYKGYNLGEGEVLTTVHEAFIYNPQAADITWIQAAHGNGDMSGYDYSGDFLKMLEMAQPIS